MKKHSSRTGANAAANLLGKRKVTKPQLAALTLAETSAQAGQQDRVPLQSALRRPPNSPWSEFVLCASYVILAVLGGWILDSELSPLTIIIFVCLKTGLVSEETFVKILPWSRK
jgi:hypothetical protein